MPFRRSASGGGEIKLLRAKINLSIPILFLSSTKCQDPWECSAPLAFWWLSAPCRIRPRGHNSAEGIYLHRNTAARQHPLPETGSSLGCDLWLSFYTKFEVSWLLKILPWAQGSSAMEVGGNKTIRRGGGGRAIDNAYLWLWKHC